MPTFSADQLLKVTKKIFEAAGESEEHAVRVAEHLVESNLVGYDSHGVVRIIRYMKYIRQGRLKVSVNPQVIKDGPTIAVIDGNWGLGQVAAYMGMDLAIKKAERKVLGAVGIIKCNHIGRLGAYAYQAAKRNFVGIVTCNSSPAWVAPYGGKTRRLGTNPLAIGIPTGDEEPFLMDFATSIAAEGKVRVKFHEKKPIPEGWILDKYGRPSINPADLYDGGALFPFGGHKGYSISLAVDLLCGALVGAGCTSGIDAYRGNGVFMLAIDVEVFTPLDAYRKRAKEALDVIRSTPPAKGFEKVMIPGEPEFISKERRLKEGISIPAKIWREIEKIASGFGLDLNKELKSS